MVTNYKQTMPNKSKQKTRCFFFTLYLSRKTPQRNGENSEASFFFFDFVT